MCVFYYICKKKKKKVKLRFIIKKSKTFHFKDGRLTVEVFTGIQIPYLKK